MKLGTVVLVALLFFDLCVAQSTSSENNVNDSLSSEEWSTTTSRHPTDPLQNYDCIDQSTDDFSMLFVSSSGIPFGMFLVSENKVTFLIWLGYLKLSFAALALCATVGFLAFTIHTYICYTSLNAKKLKTMETLILQGGEHIDQDSWRWKKKTSPEQVDENEKKRAEEFKAMKKQMKKRKNEFWKSMDVKTKINNGATFSNYVVRRKIAEGGFGKVYEVQDVNGNLYAMKVEPLTTLVYGIKQDLEVLYALKDTGGDIRFCKVFDAGVKHDLKYMVMTILGPPLQNFFIRHKKEHFPLGCVIDLAKQTLDSIEALHNAGYVHRDLKEWAENWVLGNVNSDIHEQRKVYLIDFGAVYKFLCSACERKRNRAAKIHTSNSREEVKPIVITYDDYFEQYFNEEGKRIPEKLSDELIKVDEATFSDFKLFFDENLNRITSTYVREVIRKVFEERKIDEQFALLDAMLTPTQREFVEKTLPRVNNRFCPREVLRDPHKSNFKDKLRRFFNNEGELLPELVKVENADIDNALNTFKVYFDINEKIDKARLYREVHTATAVQLCNADDLVLSRIRRCEKILKRHRCNHFKVQHDDPLPYVRPSRRELLASPYTMYYCSLSKHYVKPYGRKDDLESWLYSLVDWTATIPWRMIDDDVTMVKMKLASRWDLARREFLSRCPVEFEELLIYIDSLEFNAKPNYSYIYELFERIIRVNKLKYLPLSTIDHKQALPRPDDDTVTADQPKPRTIDVSKTDRGQGKTS